MRPDHYASRNPYSHKPQVGRAVVRATGRAGVATVKVGFKHRNKLAPLFVAAGLAIASTVLHIVDAVTGWQTALVIAVLLSLLLGGKQYLAHRREEPWPTSSLVQSWLALTSAAGWTAVAASMAPWSIPMPGLLAVGYLTAQAVWLWHHRERQEVVMEPVDEVSDEYDSRVYTWVTSVAKDGGALPGSQLVGINDLEDGLGWEAIIQLPPGDAQTSETAVAAIKRIAKAYRVPVAQVQVELPVDGMEDTARLLILTRNTLADDQLFTGPTLDLKNGKFSFGRHGDYEAAMWRLWTPDSGVNHGMVAGTTGAGKSGLLMNLCAEIRHSGRAVLLLADPENGESVRDWQIGAHCFAGSIPKIRRMLQGAERIMKSRRRRRGGWWVDEYGRKRRGRGYFNPTKEEPAVYVVIDEAPDVLADPECKRIIASLGKKGRKHGVGVIIFVQIPSLSELGGDLAVRSMLSSTNIVIFRTSDTLSKQMGVPVDLPIDPASLPVEFPDGRPTAGLGFLAKAGGRVSPMRAAYQDDPHRWATTGEPAALPQEDIDAFADDKGNFYLEWGDLLDVDDDDEEDTVPAASSPATAGAVNARPRIREYLLEQDSPVLLGVIADALSLPKPTCSMALKRMADAGEVARGSRWGTWVAVKDRELATA